MRSRRSSSSSDTSSAGFARRACKSKSMWPRAIVTGVRSSCETSCRNSSWRSSMSTAACRRSRSCSSASRRSCAALIPRLRSLATACSSTTSGSGAMAAHCQSSASTAVSRPMIPSAASTPQIPAMIRRCSRGRARSVTSSWTLEDARSTRICAANAAQITSAPASIASPPAKTTITTAGPSACMASPAQNTTRSERALPTIAALIAASTSAAKTSSGTSCAGATTNIGTRNSSVGMNAPLPIGNSARAAIAYATTTAAAAACTVVGAPESARAPAATRKPAVIASSSASSRPRIARPRRSHDASSSPSCSGRPAGASTCGALRVSVVTSACTDRRRRHRSATTPPCPRPRSASGCRGSPRRVAALA